MVYALTSKEKITVGKMMHLSLEKTWNVKEMKKLSSTVEVIKIPLHVTTNKMLWLFVMEMKEMLLVCLKN